MAGSSLSSQPRKLYQGGGVARATTVNAAGTWPLAQNVQGLNVSAYTAPVLILPEDLSLYLKTTYLQLQLRMLAGTVAAGMAWYAALFSVAAPTGLSGAEVFVLGAEVPGSRTPTFASPAAGGDSGLIESPEFTCPAAGLYCPCLISSAAMAATSQVLVIAQLSTLSR